MLALCLRTKKGTFLVVLSLVTFIEICWDFWKSCEPRPEGHGRFRKDTVCIPRLRHASSLITFPRNGRTREIVCNRREAKMQRLLFQIDIVLKMSSVIQNQEL